MLHYLVFTEHNVLSFVWYLPGHTTTEQTYTISGLCKCWCAFQLRNSATGLRQAHTNSIFSLVISVSEYYTARNNVVSCFSA